MAFSFLRSVVASSLLAHGSAEFEGPHHAGLVLIQARANATRLGAEPTLASTNKLMRGDCLSSNDKLESKNGKYFAILQSDGNFIAYYSGCSGHIALWASDTNNAAKVCLQEDGNLVATTSDDQVVWASHGMTSDDKTFLVMQNDGNIVQYTNKGRNSVVWSTYSFNGMFSLLQQPEGEDPEDPENAVGMASSAKLQQDECLYADDKIESENKEYYLIVQGDGNVVLYQNGGKVLWTLHSNNVQRLCLQCDGNFVAYTSDNQVVWTNNQVRKDFTYVIVQNDGNVVEYKKTPWSPSAMTDDNAFWDSGTAQR